MQPAELASPRAPTFDDPADGDQLFAEICRRRVPWMREADRLSLISADADAAVIDSIEWV